MKDFLKEIIRDERGIATIDWLIITGFSISAAGAVVAILLPAVQHAHTGTVNKITSITESGF
jgi:hypothetical protein